MILALRLINKKKSSFPSIVYVYSFCCSWNGVLFQVISCGLFLGSLFVIVNAELDYRDPEPDVKQHDEKCNTSTLLRSIRLFQCAFDNLKIRLLNEVFTVKMNYFPDVYIGCKISLAQINCSLLLGNINYFDAFAAARSPAILFAFTGECYSDRLPRKTVFTTPSQSQQC